MQNLEMGKMGDGDDMVGCSYSVLCLDHSQSLDERWAEWLDSKIALLINRDGVDVHEYGGKDYSE